MKEIEELEEKLGIKFKDKDLFKQAFCHRSYINENPKFYLSNNERLEFLGDAVLELIVTEHLYKNYDSPEGKLTSWRAALVNSKNLARIAKRLDFEDYLLLSRGESQDTGKARTYILGDAMEAFLGALFLDQGYEAVKKFIEKHLLVELPVILTERKWEDSKSKFQEMAQKELKTTPCYKIIKEWGPDHAKEFISGVFLGDELIAKGKGLSKQEAEENAAEKALKIKQWQNK